MLYSTLMRVILIFILHLNSLAFCSINKIGYICTSFDKKCGIGTYTNHLVNSLRDRKIDVIVYRDFYEDSNKLIEILKEDQIKILNIEYHSMLVPPIEKFIDILKKITSLNIKIVVTLHEENEYFFRILAIADHIIIHRNLTRINLPHKKITYIPLGVPVFSTQLSKNQLRTQYNFSTDQVIFSTFGFLTKWRNNTAFLIEAIPLLKKNPNWHIQFLCALHPEALLEGMEEYEKIKMYIADHDITSQITLITDFLPQNEIDERLYLSDIGFLWGTRDSKETSGASKEFIAARLPLVLIDWDHYHDMAKGTIKTPIDLCLFINTLVKIATNIELQEEKKKEMEEIYKKLNNDALIERHINIFKAII